MRIRADELPETLPAERKAYAAFMRGVATEGQQRMVARHLLQSLCGVLAVEPADLSDSERSFAAGRRWVGVVMATLGGGHLLGFPLNDGDRADQSTSDDYGAAEE